MLDIANANTNTKKQAAIWSAIYSGAGIIAAAITLNRLSQSFFSLIAWAALLIPLGLLLYSHLLTISARYELEQYPHPRWIKPLALTSLVANSLTLLVILADAYWIISPMLLDD